MNLDHPDAKPQNLVDVGQDVGGMSRVQTAAGEKTPGIFPGVVGDKLIYSGGEPDDFRRDIVDEHRAIDASFIQVIQEGMGRTAELRDLIEVGPLSLHQFKRVRLEHLKRLDVNVAISDQAALRGQSLTLGFFDCQLLR